MAKLLFLGILLFGSGCRPETRMVPVPAADRTEKYINLLTGKRVGIMANQTTLVNGVHLVDTLLSLGVNVDRIFSIEHGFRGIEDGGKLLTNGVDSATMLPVVSLYGRKRKADPADLEGLDMVLFDIQDVGARFYTYISSLQLLMEACAENSVKMLILDRPNPNGYYIDGPVLDTAYSSFIGMQPIPVVYGMTVGEYASMLNNEGMLSNHLNCDLEVIKCSGYTHTSRYSLPVKPSPNLPDDRSVELYPSLCFFEGTVMSVGRGTDWPFQVVGHPSLPATGFSFIPESVPWSENPLLKGEICNGYDLRNPDESGFTEGRLNLSFLIKVYNSFPEKDIFFKTYFELLAGNGILQQQIEEGISAEEIRKSWQPGLEQFQLIRKKYLLYSDF